MLPRDPFVASMLIDGAGREPYLAEMLARSLIRLGGAAPSAVNVWTLPGLPEAAAAPLRNLGCAVDDALAESDEAVARNGPLRQLDAFCAKHRGRNADLWTYALGTAVTAPPLPRPALRGVAGKTPERPLLPMPLVERVFAEARVALPAVVRCDAELGTTIATHVDVGLLYVSHDVARALAAEWRRWTRAVAARPELAGHPERDRVLQELSLALALAALEVAVIPLGANDSFPLGCHALPPSYRPAEPVRALRCGAQVDEFALVAAPRHAAAVDAAVGALNAVLAEPSDSSSFAGYKRAAVRRNSPPELAGDDPFVRALAATIAAFGRRPRLVVHAGTPKTGTKALQRALFRNAASLQQAGVWYPPANVESETKKHQFFIPPLQAGDAAGFAAEIDGVLRDAPPGTRTIVVSSEGFFNHWWDFPPASKAMLRHLAAVADVELWACFREPLAFAIKQHAQLLRNPRVFSPAYGLDAGLDEMLDDPWFVKRLDYYGFVLEAESLVGAGKVRAFRYGPDIVERVFRALGARAPAEARDTVNPSLRRPGVDLMRIVNRYDLPPGSKDAASALVLELDALIGDRAEPLRASAYAAGRIGALTARGWRAMQELLDHEPAAR